MIFAIVRHGNEEEGADGDDTVDIVRASSMESAVLDVDQQLSTFPAGNVKTFCKTVHVLDSRIDETDKNTTILMGPLYGIASIRASKKSYFRHEKDEQWSKE